MFDDILRGADAGRIDQVELQSAFQPDVSFDDVAGRTGDVGDDGFFFLQQRIQQGALSDVGTPDDRGLDAFADDLPAVCPL